MNPDSYYSYTSPRRVQDAKTTETIRYWYTATDVKSQEYIHKSDRDQAAQRAANAGHTVKLYSTTTTIESEGEQKPDKADRFRKAKVGTVWGRYSTVLSREIRLIKTSDSEVVLIMGSTSGSAESMTTHKIDDTAGYLNSMSGDFQEMKY